MHVKGESSRSGARPILDAAGGVNRASRTALSSIHIPYPASQAIMSCRSVCIIKGISGIRYLVFAMGNFCLEGAVSDDVPPGAQRAWCIEARWPGHRRKRKRFPADRSMN